MDVNAPRWFNFNYYFYVLSDKCAISMMTFMAIPFNILKNDRIYIKDNRNAYMSRQQINRYPV